LLKSPDTTHSGRTVLTVVALTASEKIQVPRDIGIILILARRPIKASSRITGA
jgi:hypothetical protein